jgi:hypothetical protein
MPLTRKRFLEIAGGSVLGTAAYVAFGCPNGSANGQSGGKKCPVPTTRYRYNGRAVGIRGEITDPKPKAPLTEQPVVELDSAKDAQHDERRVEGVGYEGVFYVGEAYSLVSGNPDSKGCSLPVFRTLVTSTVRGLDVDGVIRADSIVANLESQQPEVIPPPHDLLKFDLDMLPVGYFDDLRIRDRLIELGRDAYLASLQQHGTRKKIDPAIKDEVAQIEQEMARERQPGDNVCTDPSHTYARGVGTTPNYKCSIFSEKGIKKAFSGVPGVKVCKGGLIHIADLGDLYLGRFEVEKDEKGKELRTLTMLRVELNSPPSGWLEFGSVRGDGSPA